MSRLVATVFIFLISLSTWATEQLPDVFEGREGPVELVISGISPLEQYFYRSSVKYPFEMMGTGNHRGHVASWSVKNDQLFLVKVMIRPEKRSHKAHRQDNSDLVEYDFSGLSKLENTENGIRASWYTGAILLAVGNYHIGYTSYEIMWISGGKLTESIVLSPDDFSKGAREAYSDKPRAELSDAGKTVDKLFSTRASIDNHLPDLLRPMSTNPPSLSAKFFSSELIPLQSDNVPFLRTSNIDRYKDPKITYDVDNIVGIPKYVYRGNAGTCRRSEIPSYSLNAKFHFDKQGRLVEASWPSYAREEFIYPRNKARNTGHRRYSSNAEDEKPRITRFKRDSAGNVVTDHKIQAYTDGTFTRASVDYWGNTATEKYDNSGYLIGKLVGMGDEREITEYTYIFDEDENVLEEKSVQTIGSETIRTVVREFNKKGHVVRSGLNTKSSYYEEKTYITKFEYEYDQKGNWILKKACDTDSNIISGDDECTCFPRKIEYHDE